MTKHRHEEHGHGHGEVKMNPQQQGGFEGREFALRPEGAHRADWREDPGAPPGASYTAPHRHEERQERGEPAQAMGKAGTTVKEGMVGSLKGINEIEAEIVTLVRNTVADTLQNTGAVATAGVSVARDVLKGAIAAVDEIGTGLTVGTKSVAKGVMMGVSDVGGDFVSVARMTVKGAVNGASEVGADVGLVARRTVDGILEATREIGGNVENVAQEVVTGAIDAAGAIGTSAVENVRGMLVGIVEGVKDVVGAAMTAGGRSEGAMKPGPAARGERETSTAYYEGSQLSMDMTPGRAASEGPAIASPSHERWEQDTYDRPPVEGPDFPELGTPPPHHPHQRPHKK